MAKKNVGDTFSYTADDDVTYLATVLNTYTDEDNTDMVTLSLSGTERIIKVENSFS